MARYADVYSNGSDTSSDEVCSHLCDEAFPRPMSLRERKSSKRMRHLAGIAAHIAKNGWQLIDLDDKPTRWGRWDPDYFDTEEGQYDRGLQALQVSSFMKTAHVLAGDPQSEKLQRLVDLKYPSFTLRHQHVSSRRRSSIFLDELALWSYANLLEYEQDPLLRRRIVVASNEPTKSFGSNRILGSTLSTRTDCNDCESKSL